MWLENSSVSDYLDANALRTRTVVLRVDTPQLLRVGSNRCQRRRQSKLLEQVRNQLRDQMRSRRRRAFRGDVSIELCIFAPDTSDPPSAPKSVKRYLDALTGIVYSDDRQVGHLFVRRFALDHPYVRWVAGGNDARLLRERRDGSSVYVKVTPLRLYVADYDRAFECRDELPRENISGLPSDAAAFFERSFLHDGDDVELGELHEERRREETDQGVDDLVSAELAATMREMRGQRITELQSKLVLDQRPDRYDRPGFDLAARDERLAADLGLQEAENWRRVELQGTSWFPLPRKGHVPGQPRWENIVREHMHEHRSQWGILPPAFDQPLALDIAIYGADTNARDIDNVAHTILTTFEDLYCGEQRGTVVAYRVYRCAGTDAGVRVHVMPNERLVQLDTAITAARELVLQRGPRCRDW